MGVPVAAAAVHGDHRHGNEPTAPRAHRQRLGRRQRRQGVGVVGPVPVQGHHERERAAGGVPGGIGDGVPDDLVAGPGEEAPRERRARRREGEHGPSHCTAALHAEQLLASGEHAVAHELDARHPRGHRRHPGPGGGGQDPAS